MYKSYKPIGLSPLEHIKDLKQRNQIEYIKASYAGRLDPMAHGLMIYLLDEECKNQDKYIGYDKTYRFKLAFGFTTDTFDILGRILKTSDKIPNITNILTELEYFKGEILQEYPPFSSFVIDKKPLWQHYLEHNIDNITIPKKKVNIKSIKLLNTNIINFDIFQENVINKLKLMKSNNFRNDEIINDWLTIKKSKKSKICIYEFEANVSSGTYIRSICHKLGEKLGCGGIAYDILRIKIGDYILE